MSCPPAVTIRCVTNLEIHSRECCSGKLTGTTVFTGVMVNFGSRPVYIAAPFAIQVYGSNFKLTDRYGAKVTFSRTHTPYPDNARVIEILNGCNCGCEYHEYKETIDDYKTVVELDWTPSDPRKLFVQVGFAVYILGVHYTVVHNIITFIDEWQLEPGNILLVRQG